MKVAGTLAVILNTHPPNLAFQQSLGLAVRRLEEPTRARLVAGARFLSLDGRLTNSAKVVRLPEEVHQVDEHGSDVETVAHLTRLVIEGEGVVEVVESLADSPQSNQPVLGWVDLAVVRSDTVVMGEGIYQPGHVKGEDVTRASRHRECYEGVFTPRVPGYQCRHQRADTPE